MKDGLSFILAALSALVVKYDSLRKAAKVLGVSPAYLSDVIREQRRPGPKLLKQLGFTAKRTITVTYSRKPR